MGVVEPEPGCSGRRSPLLLGTESSSEVLGPFEAVRSVTCLPAGPFPSSPARSPAAPALLRGDKGRDQSVLIKDVAAAPLMPGHLRERTNSLRVSEGDETLRFLPPSETGGIGDRNSVRCPRARRQQLRGEALSKPDRASRSKEPCSLQGLQGAGICSLCLIQKSPVLGQAFWAHRRRHLFYRVFRTARSSAFPQLGRAGRGSRR